MRLGNYKELITIQKPIEANDHGKVTVSWINLATVYASILPIRPIEAIRNGAVVVSESYTIRIHFRSDVTSACRIYWGGKTLEISSAYDPDGKRKELELIGVCNG